jgi:putative SOS response-associated peptidase YedK
VPAGGFYEWLPGPDGGKQPYHVSRRDGEPLALAGLWETWHDPNAPDAEPLRTCAIVTTAARGRLARLHHRAPVMLPAERWAAWLDPDTTGPQRLEALLEPIGDGDVLAITAVSPAVNSSANDGPHLLDTSLQEDATLLS